MTQTTTKEEIRESAERALNAKGLDLETFVTRGKADELDDAELRELWLLFKCALNGSD